MKNVFGKRAGMQFLTAAGAGLWLMLAPTTAQVQVTTPIQVAVVDILYLLDASPQTQALYDALRQEFAPREQALLAQQDELIAQERRYEIDAITMSSQQRLNLENTILDLQIALQRNYNAFVEDLERREIQALNELQFIVLQSIQNYAHGANVDLVLADGIVYASDTVDITDRVLDALRREFQNP